MTRVCQPDGDGRFVLVCDHASRFVAPELTDLGLAEADLMLHIGWDIGAAGVTEALSEILDAPAILCGTSRLVIDCNRHLDAVDLIPEISDGTVIPGNAGLSEAAREQRVERYFRPYHDAVEAVIEGRRGKPCILVSIHSMTPRLVGGDARPWQIALSSHPGGRPLADQVLTALRKPGDVIVGDNQPYDMDPAVDYSVPFHALRRGWPYVQVEFRQDEIADAAAQRQWAMRFGKALLGISAHKMLGVECD